jgi:hypothetical protein
MKVTKLDKRFTLYHRGYIHAVIDVEQYGPFMDHVKTYFADKKHLYDFTTQRKRIHGLPSYRRSVAVIGFRREEDLTMVLLSFNN